MAERSAVQPRKPDAGPPTAADIRQLAKDAKLVPAAVSGFSGCDKARPLVICVVRNERRRLRDFLYHYRRLGAGHFLIIDNGSTDGSTAMLAGEGDIDLFQTDARFSAASKHGWVTRLVEDYGDRWYLLVDADEQAVFDGAADLQAVAQAAEAHGRRRVRGALIDMYGDKPIAADHRPQHQPLVEAYPYFDSSGYTEKREAALTTRTGGPRRRAFGHLDDAFDPQLTKYPLFRLGAGESLISPHFIDPPLEGDDPCWLGLLHFKFDGDTPERVADAVRRGQYWRESYEYRVYQEALRQQPGLTFMTNSSARYTGPRDLVRLGLIDTVPQPRKTFLEVLRRRLSPNNVPR